MKKTYTVRFSNDFHGTHLDVQVSNLHTYSDFFSTKKIGAYVKNSDLHSVNGALCGMSDCCCQNTRVEYCDDDVAVDGVTLKRGDNVILFFKHNDKFLEL